MIKPESLIKPGEIKVVFVRHFDPVEWGMPPHSIKATDSSQLLALVMAKQLIDDFSRMQQKSFNRARTSVILGVTAAQQLFSTMASRLQRPSWEAALRDMGYPDGEVLEACDRIAEKFPQWQENTFPGLLGNVLPVGLQTGLTSGIKLCDGCGCASAMAA